MRVGILTFNQALNYGAVLQAYALKRVCEELGHQVTIINYEYYGIDEKVDPLGRFLRVRDKRKALPGLIREILSYCGNKKREQSFLQFRKDYLNETDVCRTLDDIKKTNVEAFIAGSDQIWNYQITGGRFDPVFFMDFDTQAKRIIYAASSQDVPFPEEMEEKFKEILMNVDIPLGIREKKLEKYVSKLTQKHNMVVLDPTLLAGKEILEELAPRKKEMGEYVLLYQIDRNPESNISVRTLEKRFCCPVYTMTVPRMGDTHGRKGTCGPTEFLELLQNAKCLVTNSFHGIALSIIFEKQFFVYENGGVMSRIDGLLEQFELTGRKVRMVEDIHLENQIDYSLIQGKLAQLRKCSKDFLIQALK